MRTRTLKLALLTFASAAILTSCKHTGDWETDSKTGVVYRFLKHDDNGMKGSDSGAAKVVLSFTGKTKSGQDSVFFDSRKRGDSTGAITLSLQKTYHACLEEGLLLMSPGDSAEFQINADSLYLKFFHYPPNRIPPGVTATTVYTFHIKLISFMSKKGIAEENNKQRQKYMQQIMARKAMEANSIADYLKKNNLENVKPASDSIYYIETKKGKGKEIKEGDSIQVGYKGMLLDGTIFDQSDKGPGHTTLGLLYSKDPNTIRVIQGWINILGKMHEGESAKVLIPSALAYGARGMGPIQPFTPLIFEMEVVSVKSNK
jgi:FKBP-type peptidyl-prolyl cis-trans isomerase